MKPTDYCTSESPSFVMGIDLGGTSVKLGLLRGEELVARDQISTAHCDEPSDVFRRAREFSIAALHRHGATFDALQSVGLAMAGVIDETTATLMETANLHAWHGIGFHQELARVFQKPVAVINDANAAALGESSFGEHRTDSLSFLTLGTGIGGGIIVSGRAINGSHGCGGEIGHVTIEHGPDARQCGCGRWGHLEAYAGAAGIVKTALEQLEATDQRSPLRDADELTPEIIAAAAERGDAIAMETVRRTGVHLGRAIAMLAHIADPAVVLLGGAVNFGGNQTRTGRAFLRTIRSEMVRLSLVQTGETLKIDFATLGNDAGMLGAAQHARQLTHQADPSCSNE
ncbi:ROK family protein [Stieleria sp. ICT_E10.1]|uniref:ROK family protein n=1 Tax=Stieleria sedimenti TaxID=2976331 RepID=UPI00217F7D6F|nr:ROK family protein [Stieleria sedimenti]MCS7471052.1 ROK family protein [Stieleria sedimenti]